MGFAKFLGRDKGISWTPKLRAFQNLFYWTLTGWVLCFGLSMLFIQPPNFIIPILAYLIITSLLYWNYHKSKDEKKRD